MRYAIEQTEVFSKWHQSLRDLRARFAIARRIERAALGNLGDAKPVRESLSELRVDVGAGYRVYFTVRGAAIIFLLCGGDKSSQEADIKRALKMLKEI